MKVIKVKNYDEVSAEAFKVMKEVVTSKKGCSSWSCDRF